MYMNENDIINDMEFRSFLELFNEEVDNVVDIYYLNNKTVSESIKKSFNTTLIKCKHDLNIPILSTLTKLSEGYLEPKIIQSLLNNRVRWELIEEMKKTYPFIEKNYFNTTLSDYFY
jgi:hypothetical protein